MPASFFTPLDSSQDVQNLLQGAILLFPAVSIGSVPQLAIDLLLQSPTFELQKVGRLDPSFCLPFTGPYEKASGDIKPSLATALEVYANGKGLVVVQQRSPVLKSRQNEFLPALAHWITESQIAESLWVSSIDAAARVDSELETPILSLTSSSKTDTPVLTRLTTQFPPFAPTQNTVPHIPGALLTRKAVQLPLPNTAALLYFAEEGDTRPHAHVLAKTIASLIAVPIQAEFAEPISWQFLFGNPPDSSLYG